MAYFGYLSFNLRRGNNHRLISLLGYGDHTNLGSSPYWNNFDLVHMGNHAFKIDCLFSAGIGFTTFCDL